MGLFTSMVLNFYVVKSLIFYVISVLFQNFFSIMILDNYQPAFFDRHIVYPMSSVKKNFKTKFIKVWV